MRRPLLSWTCGKEKARNASCPCGTCKIPRCASATSIIRWEQGRTTVRERNPALMKRPRTGPSPQCGEGGPPFLRSLTQPGMTSGRTNLQHGLFVELQPYELQDVPPSCSSAQLHCTAECIVQYSTVQYSTYMQSLLSCAMHSQSPPLPVLPADFVRTAHKKKQLR